jgi:C4-dicarboxylate transporter DctM subunit
MTLAAFVFLLVIGMPIGFVLCGAALAYILASGNQVLLQSYPLQLFSGANSYGLLAIPLFILIGELMAGAGITQRLVRLATAFIGSVRGGLAHVNVVANMLVASILGSATAQIAVMSRVMVPEMERAGYDKPFAAGLTAFGGILGPIIPPSIVFVVYAVLAQVAVGDMLLAGLLPGLMLSGMFFLTIAAIGWLKDLPATDPQTLRQRLRALVDALPMLAIPGVIVGTILTGTASPTESAAIGALAALLIGVFYTRELKVRDLPEMLLRTGLNSAIVLFMVATANVFSWVLVFGQVPQAAAAWIQTVADDPVEFMLLVNAMLLGVGTVIDGIPGLIMTVPILLPIATDVYGIDPRHFGVVVSINLILGLLSPPVGIGLFMASAMTGVKPGRIVLATLPFFLVTCVLLVILSITPELSLMLLD